MASSLYDRLQDFGTLVYTVGDGVDAQTTAGLNDLSKQNALTAAAIALRTHDAILFIAGGNGGDAHGRDAKNRLPGSEPEAIRMEREIRSIYPATLPIITDCDPTFRERFMLDPSHDTPENARNTAAVFEAGGMKNGEVVAERIHLGRVIATLVHAMRRKHVDAMLRSHPVDATFESTNDQWHIRNKGVFRLWNMVGWAEHIARGKVDRWEAMKELLSLDPYSEFQKGRSVRSS